jgi:hypothetical protein
VVQQPRAEPTAAVDAPRDALCFYKASSFAACESLLSCCKPVFLQIRVRIVVGDGLMMYRKGSNEKYRFGEIKYQK